MPVDTPTRYLSNPKQAGNDNDYFAKAPVIRPIIASSETTSASLVRL